MTVTAPVHPTRQQLSLFPPYDKPRQVCSSGACQVRQTASSQ